MWPSDGSLVPGPIEPITKRGRSGGRAAGGDLAGDLGRALVDLERLVGDLVLVEHQRERAEGGGLDRVDAGLEELGVHLGDEVGPGEHEVLVAALEREAAEVVGAEVVALHPGAERAVEHEHALRQRIEERRLGATTDRGVRATGVDHQTRVGAPIRAVGIHRLTPRAAHDRDQSATAADKVRGRSARRSRLRRPHARRGRGAVAARSPVLAMPVRGWKCSRRVHGRGRLRGQARRDARGARRRASSAPRPSSSSGSVTPTRSMPTPSRRAGATLAKRGRKVATVATTLLDAAPESVAPEATPRRHWPKACSSGPTSSSSTRATRRRRSCRESCVLGRTKRQGEGRDRARRRAIADRGDVGSRPRQRARGREVAARSRRARHGRRPPVGPQGQGVLGRAARTRAHGRRDRRRPGFGARTAVRPARLRTRGREDRRSRSSAKVSCSTPVVSRIKTASGMETMKTDMSGGAAVIAAMSALEDLGVKTRVLGYVPLVENMPSGTAIRPGDVLKMRNGKTVEVLNTDAEGRLILADALSLAVDEKPDAIVDLATLTGACMVALGDKVAGLMGSDEGWVDQVRGGGRSRRRVGVAPPAARGVPQVARVRGRRHPQHRNRWLRRRADRGTVPQGVHRRRARGRTSTSRARHALRATTATPSRAAPASASAPSSSSPTASPSPEVHWALRFTGPKAS